MNWDEPMVSAEALDAAIRAQFPHAMPEVRTDAIAARHFHDEEVFRTQNGIQQSPKGDVLVIIRPPEYIEKRTSCNGVAFKEVHLRLDYNDIVNTGSTSLRDKLESAKYQNRMKRRVDGITEGVTHVLDLSPSLEEDDCSVALQDLTITKGIKLWFRTMHGSESVSSRLVGGHDDVCFCRGDSDVVTEHSVSQATPMIMLQTPQSAHSPPLGEPKEDCIYDTKPLSVYRDISDYCPIRQVANTIRLFRTIAGEDLLIDSAPRMWTLVGLFKMFDMTNHDILRDSITAWLMADPNSMFMEVLPEETLHVATVLESQAIAEPAFRILVNERAIAVAGRSLSRQHQAQTIFGRKSSDCLSGSEFGESVLRMVEHAGVAMADRIKTVVDRLLGPECFDELQVFEWKKLLTIENTVQQTGRQEVPFAKTLKDLMDGLRNTFHADVRRTFKSEMPVGADVAVDKARRHYISPKDMFNFRDLYKTLNDHERALTPYFWQLLGNLPPKWTLFKATPGPNCKSLDSLADTLNRQLLNFGEADTYLGRFDLMNFHFQLGDALRKYVARFTRQDGQYMITPHLLLSLNDEEMNFLRLGSEAVFDDNVPPTWMGPSGPGPSYHTGQTVGSVTGSSTTSFGMGKLAIDDDDSATATGVPGSSVAQDGISTVYRRDRVIAPNAQSVASEQFSAGDMEYEQAQFSVPDERQGRGKALAALVEEDGDDIDYDKDFEMMDDSDDPKFGDTSGDESEAFSLVEGQ